MKHSMNPILKHLDKNQGEDLSQLTQSDVNRIVALHEKWLNNEEGGECAFFNNCNLEGLCFPQTNLRRMYFYGSRIVNCSFGGTNLTDTVFSLCHIRMCDFKHANMTDAYFEECDVKYCILYKANLSGIRFPDCHLSSALANLKKGLDRFYWIVNSVEHEYWHKKREMEEAEHAENMKQKEVEHV